MRLIQTLIFLLFTNVVFGQTQSAAAFLIKEVDLGGYHKIDNVYQDKDYNFFILRRPNVNHVLMKVDSNLNVADKVYPLRDIMTSDEVLKPVASRANTIIGNEVMYFTADEVTLPEEKLTRLSFPDLDDLRAYVISPNAKFFVCLPHNKEVIVYAWFSNKNKWKYHGTIQAPFQDSYTWASGISENGRYLALSYSNYETVVYDLVLREEVKRIGTGRVNDIHFLKDKMVLSTNRGSHIYSTAVFEELDYIEHRFFFCNTHIDENGQYLVAFGMKNKAYKEPNSIELYDFATGKRKKFTFKPSSYLKFVRLTKSGKLYAFSNRSLGLYDISNLKDL